MFKRVHFCSDVECFTVCLSIQQSRQCVLFFVPAFFGKLRKTPLLNVVVSELHIDFLLLQACSLLAFKVMQTVYRQTFKIDNSWLHWRGGVWNYRWNIGGIVVVEWPFYTHLIYALFSFVVNWRNKTKKLDVLFLIQITLFCVLFLQFLKSLTIDILVDFSFFILNFYFSKFLNIFFVLSVLNEYNIILTIIHTYTYSIDCNT